MRINNRDIQFACCLLLIISLMQFSMPINAQMRQNPQKKESCNWSGSIKSTVKFSETTSLNTPLVNGDKTTGSRTKSFGVVNNIIISQSSLKIDSYTTNSANHHIGMNASGKAPGTVSGTYSDIATATTERERGGKKCTATSTSNIQGKGNAQFSSAIYLKITGKSYTLHFAPAAAVGQVTNKHSGSGCGTGSSPETVNNNFAIGMPSINTLTGEINPKTPDRISGSKTIITPSGQTETVEWKLELCAPPLQIVGLKLEHHEFPNKEEWSEFNDKTVDGNQVRVTATVLNNSRVKYVPTMKFRELKEYVDLPDSEIKFSVEPGKTADVEYVWDTSGYAWSDGGTPRMEREIQAKITEDEASIKVNVVPKPVILVHGLNSEAATWDKYEGFLKAAHSSDWLALPVVGMNTGAGLSETTSTNTLSQNAQIMADYVNSARETLNAWHVDVVGHSMGGLISRLYINSFMPDDTPNKKPVITHLVMLGTPNMGSSCADNLRAIHGIIDADVEAVRQLTPKVMDEFNRNVTNRKNVKFSVLAGDPLPISNIPVTIIHSAACREVALVPNDGVVKVESAFWTIDDRDLTKSLHTFMTTSESDFKSFVLPRLARGPKLAQQ